MYTQEIKGRTQSSATAAFVEIMSASSALSRSITLLDPFEIECKHRAQDTTEAYGAEQTEAQTRHTNADKKPFLGVIQLSDVSISRRAR